jgi:hypothetical protein
MDNLSYRSAAGRRSPEVTKSMRILFIYFKVFRTQADVERIAREKAMRDAAAGAQEVRDELASQEAAAAEAEAVCASADRDIAAARAACDALRAEATELAATIEKARLGLIQGSSFSALGGLLGGRSSVATSTACPGQPDEGVGH